MQVMHAGLSAGSTQRYSMARMTWTLRLTRTLEDGELHAQ
jgi:hypothetical protein